MTPPIEELPTQEDPTPKDPLSTIEEIAIQAVPEPVEATSTPEMPTIKIPNVAERPIDSQATSPSSDGTAVNNTPALRQDPTFAPKLITPTQRTNSSFATKGSPKIQNLSRTFTTGVTTLSKHKLWNQNQEHHDGQAQWGVNWYMPSHMAFLGIAGAAGAIGHHFYNINLHGHIVKNSDWVQRWGLALAFFIKFCLVGAVQIAYKQTVWLTMKKKLLKVKTIDSLFSACSDPLEFLNLEFLLKAAIPALLAGLVWLLPLCAIASPASLTSISKIQNESTICSNIPTLDFTRDLTLTIDSDEEGMCFWDYKDDANHTEYYNSPSDRLVKIATIELLAGKGALQPPNPCTGYNCTYSITFSGPTYQCVDQPDFDIPSNRSVTKDLLVPTGNFSYLALSSVLEDDVGRPLSWINASESDLGKFIEPDLWIGYIINTSIPLAEPIITPWGSVWGHKLIQKISKCSMYTTQYTLTLTWLDGVMTIIDMLTKNSVLLTTIDPADKANYRYLAGYHALGFIFRQKLAGFMNNTGETGYATTTTGFTQTDLVGDYGLPLADFETNLEWEFTNMVLSIASDDVMQVYTTVNPPCVVSKTELIWNYRPLWLVLSYSLAVSGMLAAVIMGVFAYKWNGYGTDMSFSSILVTTRNKELDQLAEGSCLGNTPLSKDITDQRLRFGELRDSRIDEVQGQAKHTGFGLSWQAGPITIGERYS